MASVDPLCSGFSDGNLLNNAASIQYPGSQVSINVTHQQIGIAISTDFGKIRSAPSNRFFGARSHLNKPDPNG
jgi:hypothetical protein